MTRTVHVSAEAHGRVLVRDAAGAAGVLVGFHGYGQTADDMLADLVHLGGDRWQLVSVQALHPFYTRDNQRVIASWMTRQDRDLAAADNVAYVDRVVDQIDRIAQIAAGRRTLVFVGFSQGASMAYRAAALGRHAASGVIALAGDVPPEAKAAPARALPPVLIGAGERDAWFTSARLDADASFLRSTGVDVTTTTFAGGHEWTDAFTEAARAWLADRA